MNKWNIMACMVFLLAISLASCSEKDEEKNQSPIENLVLPLSDAENPIRAGQAVEIKGKGFAPKCKLWLQPTATTRNTDITLEVTITSTGVSFVAPDIAGEYSVILNQDGISYVLGNLYFAGEELTKLPDVFTGKRVTKIEWAPSDKGWEEFTYTKGKLTKYIVGYFEDDKRDETVYNITYTGNQVKFARVFSTGSKEKEEFVYTLDANGYAVSSILKQEGTDEDDGKFFTYTATQTFEYTGGYLTKTTLTDEAGTDIGLTTYKDGNVVSHSYYDSVGQRKDTYEYTASDILNKGGVLPPNNGWIDVPFAYYAGILGKPTKNLIVSENNESYVYEMVGEYVKNCVAVLDDASRETYTYTFE